MIMEINYDKLALTDNGCIEEVKEVLDIDCNFKAGQLIGRVLHTIRDSLSYAESAELIKELPDNIKIIYVSDWKLKTDQIELTYLDDLVREVIKNDKDHTQRVLHTEVMALDTIITTIKALNKYVNLLSSNFLKYPLKHELEEAIYKAA